MKRTLTVTYWNPASAESAEHPATFTMQLEVSAAFMLDPSAGVKVATNMIARVVACMHAAEEERAGRGGKYLDFHAFKGEVLLDNGSYSFTADFTDYELAVVVTLEGRL